MSRNWSFSGDPVRQERFLKRYLRHFNVPFEEAVTHLHTTSVRLVPTVDIDLKILKEFLTDLGIRITNRDASLVVPITDSYLTSKDHHTLIHQAIQERRACLPVQIGIISLVGPYLAPSSSLCWDCFKSNLHRQNSVDQTLAKLLPSSTPIAVEMDYPSLMLSNCLYHVARNLLRLIIKPTRSGDHVQFYVSNNAIGSDEQFTYVRWARCKACLEKDVKPTFTKPEIDLHVHLEAIELSSSPDTLNKSFQSLELITNPYSGILKTLSLSSSKDETDAGLHMAVSRHPFFNYLPSDLSPTQANHLSLLNDLYFNSNRQSSAIGSDSIRTLVRAGNEAYEKCASAYRGDEQHKVATWDDMGPDALKNTSLFPLTVDEKHALDTLPDKEHIAWTPSWSLTYEKTRWIPAAHCFFGFPSGLKYVQGHTRGLAAGPSLEFCIYKGLAELIETLGTRRWQKSKKKSPEVLISSFNDPLFDRIKNVHERKGRTLWVLDISHFTKLPFYVFVAMSFDSSQNTLLKGIAASYTPSKAIRSALLECTQMLPNLLLSSEEQADSRSVTFGLKPYHERGGEQRTADSYENDLDYSTSIHDLVQELQLQNIEVIVKDQTREEVPIHVARVIFCRE